MTIPALTRAVLYEQHHAYKLQRETLQLQKQLLELQLAEARSRLTLDGIPPEDLGPHPLAGFPMASPVIPK